VNNKSRLTKTGAAGRFNQQRIINMADIRLRLAENVPGRFFVTSECIDCDMCRETAPSVFRRNDDIAFSVVFHQPETEVERQQAEEALNGCPVEAIGKEQG
jgi:ferredoxin